MLLRDATYQAIRHAILTCEFQPGQELREQILAERYRVSRSPIRDLLLRLERENLVTVMPRQGYRVRPISVSDVTDVFVFRLLIEPACAAAAAQADDTALQALDRFRGVAEEAYTGSRWIEYDRSFHHAMADLSGNHRMAAIARDLMEQFERLEQIVLLTHDHETVRHDSMAHEAIITALQAHDAERASRLCYAHTDDMQGRIAAPLQRLARQWQVPAEQPTATEVMPI